MRPDIHIFLHTYAQVGNQDVHTMDEVLAKAKMEHFERNLEVNDAVYDYLQGVVADWESEGAEVTALRRQVAKLQVSAYF
jgi:hypothetical protein